MDKEIMEFDNQLPARFTSWLEMYHNIKRDLVIHEAKTLSYFEGVNKYNMSVDFLKSKCFDEFMENYPTHSCIEDNYISAHYIVKRIDNLLEGKFKPLKK